MTPGAQHIRKVYRRSAQSYDRWMGLLDRLALGGLRRRLLRHASGRVLEVALGTGLSLPHYPPGCRLVGLDLVPETLQVARARAAALGRPIDLLVADAEQLPFRAELFDTVVSMLAGCTFPSPVSALRELRRVCRPAGQVLLLDHVRHHKRLIGRLQDMITPLTLRWHACHQNRDMLALARAAGLRPQARSSSLAGYLLSLQASPRGAKGDNHA